MMIWRSLDPRVIASLLVHARRSFFIGRTPRRDGTSIRAPSRARVLDERASAPLPTSLCSCNRDTGDGATSSANNHQKERGDSHGTGGQ
jgi:hypothetical protein